MKTTPPKEWLELSNAMRDLVAVLMKETGFLRLLDKIGREPNQEFKERLERLYPED